jgi:hypothetical protein
MAQQTMTTRAKVEIDAITLTRLLAKGQMHACELKCLDDQSKQLVRRLCLDTCLKACSRRKS